MSSLSEVSKSSVTKEKYDNSMHNFSHVFSGSICVVIFILNDT